MNLTKKFIEYCGEKELRKLTTLVDKDIAVLSVAIFRKFEPIITDDMEFLDVLTAFGSVADQSAMLNFRRKPHPGAINNCMGRWFELIFFKSFSSLLSAKSSKDDIKEACKLPPATKSKQFMHLFIKDQQNVLKRICPSTSNPDFLVMGGLKSSVYAPGLSWLDKFSNTDFFGKIDIQKIAAILSIKTSARPDRRYQMLYEANLVKALGIKFNKNLIFISLGLHLNEKNDEVYLSPSIVSIVTGGELKPTIDHSITLDKISDVSKVYDIIFSGKPAKPTGCLKLLSFS